MRRVLLHLGLHKTGMAAAQSFLYENRELIWPHYSMVLPYKTRKLGLSRAATSHSMYRMDSTLSAFGDMVHDLLRTLDFGTRRGLIVSEENFAGRRPSRNPIEGYAAAPELAATLVNLVRLRLEGEEVDITVYLSQRQRGSWMRSLWGHDVRHTRMVQTFDDFRAGMDHLPSLQSTVDDIRNRLPSVTVKTEWLEDLQTRRFGPGAPFAEFLNLPRNKAAALVPPKHRKQQLSDDVLTELLTLNRSSLDDAALTTQKKALVRSAQQELIDQR